MPLSDHYDVLALIDDAARGADNPKLEIALTEQGWTRSAIGDVLERPVVWHGQGWRVWYEDGRCVDSSMRPWHTLENGIVVGVAYEGLTRRLVQGVDPYWMDRQGTVHDSRRQEPPRDLDAKWLKSGVWVPDHVMSACRLKAVRSVTLERTT